jgi:hypothetical protein
MKASLEIKLGNKMMRVEGEGDSAAIIKGLAFWSQLPSKCGHCGTEDIGLSHRSTKDGDDYYELKCLKCTAQYPFHQYKKGGFYVTPDDKWTIWSGNLISTTHNGSEWLQAKTTTTF